MALSYKLGFLGFPQPTAGKCLVSSTRFFLLPLPVVSLPCCLLPHRLLHCWPTPCCLTNLHLHSHHPSTHHTADWCPVAHPIPSLPCRLSPPPLSTPCLREPSFLASSTRCSSAHSRLHLASLSYHSSPCCLVVMKWQRILLWDLGCEWQKNCGVLPFLVHWLLVIWCLSVGARRTLVMRSMLVWMDVDRGFNWK